MNSILAGEKEKGCGLWRLALGGSVRGVMPLPPEHCSGFPQFWPVSWCAKLWACLLLSPMLSFTSFYRVRCSFGFRVKFSLLIHFWLLSFFVELWNCSTLILVDGKWFWIVVLGVLCLLFDGKFLLASSFHPRSISLSSCKNTRARLHEILLKGMTCWNNSRLFVGCNVMFELYLAKDCLNSLVYFFQSWLWEGDMKRKRDLENSFTGDGGVAYCVYIETKQEVSRLLEWIQI